MVDNLIFPHDESVTYDSKFSANAKELFDLTGKISLLRILIETNFETAISNAAKDEKEFLLGFKDMPPKEVIAARKDLIEKLMMEK